MRKFYTGVVAHRRIILATFLVMAAICLLLRGLVSVNYDMKDYLPEDSPSTLSLNRMELEFEGGIPNARVMVRDVSLPQALEYKDQLAAVEGVEEVMWLDDAADLTVPLETLGEDIVETYAKDGSALFLVTIDEDKIIQAVQDLRGVIGQENAMSGDAVSTAVATVSTESEISRVVVISIALLIVVLLITTTSFAEPFIVLAGLGVAIAINAGTNVIFGEISFVTNAAGSILQLAVSLDYSVFLIHRFAECRGQGAEPREAMVNALCRSTGSISSSGLTTVIGFLALVFMRFGIGPDLGLALAKGIAISLVTVFLFMPALILAAYKLMEKTRHRSLLPDFTGLGRFICRAMLPLTCLFALILAPGYLASNSNSFYYGASHIFGEETQLGKDIASIEDVFGKNDTYALLVPRGDLSSERRLSEDLHSLPQVKSIISYVDTVGAEIPAEYLDEDTAAQLLSTDYSRMVLSVEADLEGKSTFALVKSIRELAQRYYPEAYYLAGEGVSTYDLMDTITADTVKVNLIAIGAVFLVLMLMMRSLFLPAILVLSIEAAIWLNLSIPYFMNTTIFYIAYLIISSIQLGATVDYAILFTDRYREFRKRLEKKEAIIQTVSAVTASILTSASVIIAVGFLLGYLSSHGILSQLGLFLGKGSLLSLVMVLFVLPGLLYLTDGLGKGRARRKGKNTNQKEVSVS